MKSTDLPPGLVSKYENWQPLRGLQAALHLQAAVIAFKMKSRVPHATRTFKQSPQLSSVTYSHIDNTAVVSCVLTNDLGKSV